jgi:ABC-type sugar transport system ATPase subunit
MTKGFIVMPTIELVNVSHYYLNGKTNIATAGLFQVSLILPDCHFIIIEGPSGCGKTTLLKTIAGLYTPEEGTVLFNGIDVINTPANKRSVGLVSQEYALYPNKTVFDNIGYPLKVAKVPLEELRQRVSEISQLLGIDLLLSRKPRVLSGGQRQRVALARSLIRRPDILLLDEPLSNVEGPLRDELLTLLSSLQKRLSMTLIMATHQVAEAARYGDVIVSMENGSITSIKNINQDTI